MRRVAALAFRGLALILRDMFENRGVYRPAAPEFTLAFTYNMNCFAYT